MLYMVIQSLWEVETQKDTQGQLLCQNTQINQNKFVAKKIAYHSKLPLNQGLLLGQPHQKQN